LGLEFGRNASEGARGNLQARLARLGHEDEESVRKWQGWVTEGVKALSAYLREAYPEMAEYPSVKKLNRLAAALYWGDLDGEPDDRRPGGLPGTLADLRAAVKDLEAAAVDHASERVAELEEEHAEYTRAWVKATSEMQQAVLKKDMERLEAEAAAWRLRTVPLSQRLEELYAAEAERQAERDRLLAEWPTLEAREKGEVLRRLFRTVTLFWDRKFVPAKGKPGRPLKTDRPGRYRYTLLKERIGWAFATTDLGQPCRSRPRTRPARAS
jgi:hypothetical protein